MEDEEDEATTPPAHPQYPHHSNTPARLPAMTPPASPPQSAAKTAAAETTAAAGPASSTPRASTFIEPLNLKNISTSRTPATPSVPNTAYAQRFLPKQLVMGSPFYHTSDGTFAATETQIQTQRKTETETETDSETDPKLKSLSMKEKVDQCKPRTIRFDNLHSQVSLADVLNYITLGPVETCHFDLVNPSQAILVTFLEHYTATKCFQQLSEMIDDLRNLLNSPSLEIVQVESSSPLSDTVMKEVTSNGASRALCLTSIPEDITQDQLVEEFTKFGTVSLVQYNQLKKSAFIYFTSIQSAIKCLNQIPLTNSILANCPIFYSNDGESYANVPIFSTSDSFMDTFADINDPTTSSFKKNMIYSTTPTSISSRRNSKELINDVQSTESDIQIITYPKFNNGQYSPTFSTLFYDPIHSQSGIIDNRTIYLGNLHQNTTAEDICNVIRGGMLQNVRMFKNKRAAFITFIDPLAAKDFIARSFQNSIVIHNTHVNVGWGRESPELNPIVKKAIENDGASRNLYLGINPELETDQDYDLVPLTEAELRKKKSNETVDGTLDNLHKKIYHCIPDEDTLRRDFSVFGKIEQINFFKNGACAFINFHNIESCIQAVESFNNIDDKESLQALHKSLDDKYVKLLVNYGKDRCANPPKSKTVRKSDKRKNQRLNRPYIKQSYSSRSNFSNSFIHGNGSFTYGLQDNYSVDTDLALKFESSFYGMGISSPAAKKKVSQYKDANLEDSDVDVNVNVNVNLLDDVESVTSQIEDTDAIVEPENFNNTHEDTFDDNDPNYSFTRADVRRESISAGFGDESNRGSKSTFSRSSSSTSFHNKHRFNSNSNPNTPFNIPNGAYFVPPQPYYYTPQTPNMPYMYPVSPFVPKYVTSDPVLNTGDGYFYQHYPQSHSSGHIGNRSRYSNRNRQKMKR